MKRQGSFYYYDMVIIKKEDILKYLPTYNIKEACCKYLSDKRIWIGSKPDDILLFEFNRTYHCFIIGA